MKMYESWKNLIEGQTDDSFKDFWASYSDAEVKIYKDLLENHESPMTGVFNELVAKYDVDPILLLGFFDGIESSLISDLDVKSITEDSEINLKVDFEKLFLNMLEVDAEHLYSLPEWEKIYSEEEQNALFEVYRKSRTIVKDKQPGRNEACPCGSGKKYKKCCGANL
ncbi:MAG: hypothetical protein GX780_04980 [Campylobacteraceae bacterium]|nr:hypothetical protein [Campylobacteraceae bacterium]